MKKIFVKKSELIFWLLIVIIWIALYWNQSVIKNTGDFFCHNIFAKLIVEGKLMLVYPGYHILVGVIANITGISETEASVFVLTFAQILSVIVVSEILKNLSEVWKNNLEVLIVSFMLNIVQPIFFNNYRPGASSGNGLFSPTLTMVKPFTLLVVLIFYKMYRDSDYSSKNQLLLFAALLLTCLIKPMFTMAFIPASGFLILKDSIDNARTDNVKFSAVFINFITKIMPMVIIGLILIVQFLLAASYDVPEGVLPAGINLSADGDSHIRIGYMRSWSLAVDNVYISLLFAYLFPIILLLVCMFYRKRNIRLPDSAMENLRPFRNISISYGIISFIYMAFLYQEGREIDMNFRNAWVVTFNLVYILAFVHMAELREKANRSPFPIYFLYFVWGIHMLFGAALITKYTIG